MDILRIATAGSVDDGKSTLIGRLLFETESITKDKIEAIQTASTKRGLDFLDLSLLTDGLIAEREQGITIDVANIYFNTPTRKYIIADTPGHFEYTRNMVTGTSNTKVAIVLIDARNGVVDQTKRHFFISNLLRIPNVIVAINKMDLVDYAEERFNEIKKQFGELVSLLTTFDQHLSFVPISSLYGENITTNSTKTPWYGGENLLGLLENIDTHIEDKYPARLPVQHVIRPKTDELHDFRGYAGKIASGSFKVGDAVVAYPSQQRSEITSIQKFGTELGTANAKESIQILLKDDIDISRGGMIAKVSETPRTLKELSATVCWFDQQPLVASKNYLLQHGVNRTKTKITAINNRLDNESYGIIDQPSQLNLNDIGNITLKTAAEVFVDAYATNPSNGSFILIDDQTNSTVAVGIID